jgi:carbonic anhydrase/acetyltransferase-like protein (isoleucine patch superfamily)
MAKIVSKSAFTVGLLVLMMSVPAFGASINKSVKIAAGEESGGATSVNGSITVGADATVTGNLKTVNGSIRIDDGASIEEAATVNGGVRLAAGVRAESLTTVNGSINVGENGDISDEVGAVNGRISLGKGTRVADDVGNVNGQIGLAGAEVGGNVTTVNGDIELSDGAVVKGDVVVEKPSNWSWGKEKSRKPRIVIGPGSRVEGEIRLDRKVELFISESAEVGGVSGEMTMDDAVRFAGDHP